MAQAVTGINITLHPRLSAPCVQKFVLFVTGFKSFVPSVTRNEGHVNELPCQYYLHS